MKYCPITYEPCGEKKYSEKGLRLLSRQLTTLNDLPYSAEEQRKEAASHASKISIQGVQPKLSAKINIKEQGFEITDKGGVYILKPQNDLYPELPQNEDLTMRMASLAGIEIPLHGLVYSKDASFTYFIKRFDRPGKNRKLPQEDFAQLSGNTRDTKYNFSMEKLSGILDSFCTFPALEKLKLFRLTLFNYLTGNEDMHLKNFSLLTHENKVEMSPAYDLLNSTIVLKSGAEEMALTIAGKKKNINRQVLVNYYGKERLGLNDKSVNDVLDTLHASVADWENLISISFLSAEMKDKYAELLKKRTTVLFS